MSEQFSIEDLLPAHDANYVAAARIYEDMIEAERLEHINRVISDCVKSNPEIKFNRTEYKSANGSRFRVINGGIK